MMETSGHWLPAVIAAAVGLFAGLFFIWRMRHESDAPPSDTPLVDLEERADHLVAMLRDLEEQKRRLDPASYASQKSRLENLAADALRQRDVEAKAEAGARVSTQTETEGAETVSTGAAREATGFVGFFVRHPQFKGFLWGGGSVAVFALIFGLVRSQDHLRGANGSVTGDNTMGMTASQSGNQAKAQKGQRHDAQVDHYLAILKKHPKDVKAIVGLAHRLLALQDIDDADQVNQRALQLDPNNVEAQVHAAAIESARGDAGAAMKSLEKILKKHPDSAEGWLYRGMLAMQDGNRQLAKQSWQKYVAVAPPSVQRDRVQAMLDGKPIPMTSTDGGVPPGHPPINGRNSGSGAPAAGPMMASNGGQLPAGHPVVPGMNGNSGSAPAMGGGAAAASDGSAGTTSSADPSSGALPNNITSLNDLSRQYLYRQDIADAKRTNAKALKLDPNDAEARVHAAVIKSAQGDTTDALSSLNTIVKSHPDLADAWFFRGMVCMMSGKMQLAKASWKKFVAIAPNGPQKKQVEGFLKNGRMPMAQ